MKVERDSGYVVQSTVVGDAAEMGIAQGAMAHIMSILTDLYEDAIRAFIREYGTNAWDAHVEAGVNRPIEVTLPSRMAPFFKVRDHGVGLTVEDIHAIYSQYGESTKRGTNAQNGMLGLGCKSALTYCDQFTVTSVKDSVKIIVSVGRDDEGGGTMTVVDTRTVNESNGTEVTIPVASSDVAEVVSTAADFYRVWEPNTVLIDGKAPARFEGLKLTDDIYITDDSASYVVMGNVAYPAPALDSLARGSVLAFVPIGDVNFTPSREGLRDTKRTTDTLDRIKARFAKEVQGAIQREMDAAPHPADALRTIIRWQSQVSSTSKIATSSYSYRGKPLPDAFENPAGQDSLGNPINRWVETTDKDGYQSLGHTGSQRAIPVTAWPSIVWVHGFNVKHSASIKRKLRKYVTDTFDAAEQANIKLFALLPGDAPKSDWIDPKRVVDYKTIRAIQLQPTQRYSWKPARIAGSFNLWLHNATNTNSGYQEGIPGDKIDQTNPVFYIHGNQWSGKRYYEAFQHFYAAFTVVCLPGNRVDKFTRDMPAAKHVSDGAQAAFDKWVARLTDDQRLAIHMADDGCKESLRRLDEGLVMDPDLREAIRVAKINVSKLIDGRNKFSRVARITMPNVKFTDPLLKYPLYQRPTGGTQSDHVYLYLNAAYAV